MCIIIIIGSALVFLLSKSINQDSIDIKLANLNLTTDNSNYNNEYKKYYLEENKTLPLFYFSILPSNYHPNINVFIDKKDRNLLSDLQEKGFDCSHIKDLKKFDESMNVKPSFYYPVVYFHGSENQYHYYLSSLVKGDFGQSKKDGKQVWDKIASSLNWTLAIIFFSLMISIVLSFLLTYYLVKYDGKKWEKIFSGFSLLIYSIPGFWLATIILVFFTGDQYGMPIFYVPLFVDVNDSSFLSVITKGFSKILPVIFCIVLLDIAYLTRMLKENLLEEMDKPYIMALKSRGLGWDKIMKRHAYPNVSIPIVTLLIGSLPTAIAGSLVFEIIFNIPGMGRLLHESIYFADWNVVYAIVLFVLVITVVLYALGDVIYKKLDPRI
jgi:peptide/nickel transport system permease protein